LRGEGWEVYGGKKKNGLGSEPFWERALSKAKGKEVSSPKRFLVWERKRYGPKCHVSWGAPKRKKKKTSRETEKILDWENGVGGGGGEVPWNDCRNQGQVGKSRGK